jgi:hypothetical protein
MPKGEQGALLLRFAESRAVRAYSLKRGELEIIMTGDLLRMTILRFLGW